MSTIKYSIILLKIIAAIQLANCDISLSTHQEEVKLNENKTFTLQVRNLKYENVTLQFIVQYEDIVEVDPKLIELNAKKDENYDVTLIGKGAGNTIVYANTTEPKISVSNIFLQVTVYKNKGLDIFSIIIGWIYFIAWSISFYPQIYINYKRKSVIGLNFDFLLLNVVGFSLYAIFNVCLYGIPEIENEYFARYPRSLNPIKENDIVFAVHATIACLITIVQCFLYDSGDQKVSLTARGILGIFGAFLTISIILVASNVLHWLDFLYYCSYVKLTITLIKYVPQAYMNYKRKSTVGWSIENIFLDFTGGTLSMLQMIVNAYNYDDWVSIFGDPTKFGLGLFSVVFDIFFIVQHYILYKHTGYEDS